MARINARMAGSPRITISNGRHQWFADEPLSLGGTDTGPVPYELLIGSLAACTLVTLRSYAEHKGIKLQFVETEYEFARTPGEDGALQEIITSKVTLGGDFDDSQRKRLEQIVGRCAIHKTLTHGLTVVDNVEFASGIEADAAAESGH